MAQYRKLTNPTEHDIEYLLADGFKLHSVTPIQYGGNTQLVYHFIRYEIQYVNPMMVNMDHAMPNPFEPRDSN